MNCKHCNAELGEDAKFCSSCGKPVNEPEEIVNPAEDFSVEASAQGPEIEVPQKKTGKIVMAVVAVVVLLAVLIAVIVGGLGGEELIAGDDTTVAPTAAPEVSATVPADGDPDSVTCKGSYTASDEDLIAAADTVVATMDGKELTLSQLQVYYWTEVTYFLQECSSYASYFGMDAASYCAYMGLDYTQPLDTQMCTMTEESMTWQQYFLGCALDSWQSYQAMALEAEAGGLEMDAEMREMIDELEGSLEETAAEFEMDSAKELIEANFSAGATVQSYMDFWELYYHGYTYYNHVCEQIELTEADVEAYFAENEELYAENGVTKDTKTVDVRHILIMVEGGTTDEETGETTYTDEEWAACEAEAQKILDEWLAGDVTEESFADLANTYSEDPGSNMDGGLYEEIYEGDMVTNFNDWCFDESREYGDYGLVQTEYGYHIMYYVGSEANVWYYSAESDLMYERTSAVTPEAMEKHPAEIDYSSILLGTITLDSE